MEDYKKLEMENLKRLAEVGISEAQEEMGYRLLKDISSATVLIEAVKWFTLSANQGNSLAMFHLATMYKMGLGVEKDNNKAFELYKKSSDLGLNTAKYYLADMYKSGSGVEKDEVVALEYMQESFAYSL